MLFHKVRDVAALPDMKLSVQFANGVTKVYDTKSLDRRLPAFRARFPLSGNSGTGRFSGP